MNFLRSKGPPPDYYQQDLDRYLNDNPWKPGRKYDPPDWEAYLRQSWLEHYERTGRVRFDAKQRDKYLWKGTAYGIPPKGCCWKYCGNTDWCTWDKGIDFKDCGCRGRLPCCFPCLTTCCTDLPDPSILYERQVDIDFHRRKQEQEQCFSIMASFLSTRHMGRRLAGWMGISVRTKKDNESWQDFERRIKKGSANITFTWLFFATIAALLTWTITSYKFDWTLWDMKADNTNRRLAAIFETVIYYLLPTSLGYSFWLMIYYLNIRQWECCCVTCGVCMCKWCGVLAEFTYWAMAGLQVPAIVLPMLEDKRSYWLLAFQIATLICIVFCLVSWRQYRQYRLGCNRFTSAEMKRVSLQFYIHRVVDPRHQDAEFEKIMKRLKGGWLRRRKHDDGEDDYAKLLQLWEYADIVMQSETEHKTWWWVRLARRIFPQSCRDGCSRRWRQGEERCVDWCCVHCCSWECPKCSCGCCDSCRRRRKKIKADDNQGHDLEKAGYPPTADMGSAGLSTQYAGGSGMGGGYPAEKQHGTYGGPQGYQTTPPMTYTDGGYNNEKAAWIDPSQYNAAHQYSAGWPQPGNAPRWDQQGWV